jgi:hypothetical protein
MSTFHCPYRQSTLLQQALAPDKMRIAFLLGAGCAVSVRLGLPDGGDKALIPDVAGLTKHIGDILGADAAHKTAYAALLKRLSGAAPNIEHILSHLRALYDVVRDGELGGLDQAALAALDARICELTTDVVEVDLPAHSTPYHQLAAWVGGVARTHAIEVFTPNYDLLVEQAFEAHKIPYFDGFVGARQAFFDLASVESDILPARWARLWKLHGSINWWRTTAEEVVRKSAKDLPVAFEVRPEPPLAVSGDAGPAAGLSRPWSGCRRHVRLLVRRPALERGDRQRLAQQRHGHVLRTTVWRAKELP